MLFHKAAVSTAAKQRHGDGGYVQDRALKGAQQKVLGNVQRSRGGVGQDDGAAAFELIAQHEGDDRNDSYGVCRNFHILSLIS